MSGHRTQLPVPCPGVRARFNLVALGFLAVLVVAWVIVIAAVVEIVRWAT